MPAEARSTGKVSAQVKLVQLVVPVSTEDEPFEAKLIREDLAEASLIPKMLPAELLMV